MLILVPRCLESGHNLAAIVAWHRARGGGVTLVTESQCWTGIGVITNQSCIGRGRLTWAQVEVVNARLRDLLAMEGVSLDGVYACPHRDDERCDSRKPGDHLARQATPGLGLLLNQAVVVGDKPADLGLARRLGVLGFLVTTGYGAATLAHGGVAADYVMDGLDDVARICSHPAGLAVATALPAS
jgi:histidinol-phosphate phosphatase family protein